MEGKSNQTNQTVRELIHELNNLLLIISMNIEIGLRKIEKGSCDLPTIAKRMENIKKTIMDAEKILFRFRSLFNPSESNKIRTTTTDSLTEPVDINSIIQETIVMTLPTLQEELISSGIPPIEVLTNLKDLPPVLCNPSELKEVLINLIKNAREAMPEGGWLIFNTWAEEDEIFITVSDLGKGIPRQIQEKILEPYFTTKGALGDGLGLHISNKIITQHRGNLQVLSEENIGTTFIIRIPIKR